MVQFKAVTKGLNQAALAEALDKPLEAFKREFLEGMAERIAVGSPVDTGTYATNHEVRLRSGSFTPNVIKDPNAPSLDEGQAQAARQEGLGNMLRDIAAIDLAKDTIVFRNTTTHAVFVEDRDNVYSAARREAGAIMQDAAAKARSRT